jgi:branched-chain amino acid transport system permease protein
VTVVLIEHNMKLVMGLCGVITVLDFGRKIAGGRRTRCAATRG